MKRVLFIGTTYYNLSENSHLRNKFEGLSKGMKVFVLARGKFCHCQKWKSDFYLLPKNFLFWPITFFLSFYLCLSKKIDVVVCQSPIAEGFIGALLKKILKKELVVEAHGDWVEGTFLSRKRRFEFLERKIIPYLVRFSLRNADKIRAISQATKIQARKISKDKPYFIFPTFTDLDIFLKQQDIRFDNYILFVGHLEKVKGAGYLIAAFNKIKREFPDFRLVLIGQGGEKKNYQLSIINYQLQARVELTGELPLTQVRDIMKDCYCLVLPSLSEGLGRVLMEAMALGKPVIGSNVGGISDLIQDGDNGFLTEPGNSNNLADRIRVLLKDKDLAAKMGANGRRFVRYNFSNHKYIENYITMINN